MTDPYRPLKNAFGRFATGVCVVACANDRGGHTAITVNSFTSVSLEPPLVSWCLENRASSFVDFMTADGYAVSVLSSAQQAVSHRFARHDPGPLAPADYEIWETGAPILAERLSGFDCRIVDRHPAGDHVILIAEVVRFDARPGDPLVYFGSDYRNLELEAPAP
jgi:flavin reductase (DIM6/NTAB) family NADH-FMN oxidoreductase RutF